MAIENVDPAALKANSEKTVLQAGGRICSWLPVLDRSTPRAQAELVQRALILNALVNIAFGAPTRIIQRWIEANGLAAHLTPKERVLLRRQREDLSEQEVTDLKWSLEALWALMWAGGLTPDLSIDTYIPDTMASLLPDLEKNEDGTKLTRTMRLRPSGELFQMLDLYFRAHWYTEDGRINGYDMGSISGDVVMERRKALEWLMDAASDWDDIAMNT